MKRAPFVLKILIALSLTSIPACKSIPLTKDKLSKISVVALNISSVDLGVGTVGRTPPGHALLIPIALAIDAVVKAQRTDDLIKASAFSKAHVETLLRDPFLENIRAANIFKTVDYSNSKCPTLAQYKTETEDKDALEAGVESRVEAEAECIQPARLLAEGYHAMIKINMDIHLKEDSYDLEILFSTFRLYTYVRGSMIDLEKEEIIWKRREVVKDEQARL